MSCEKASTAVVEVEVECEASSSANANNGNDLNNGSGIDAELKKLCGKFKKGDGDLYKLIEKLADAKFHCLVCNKPFKTSISGREQFEDVCACKNAMIYAHHWAGVNSGKCCQNAAKCFKKQNKTQR